MFEKEAEKWTIDYVCKDCSRYKECRSKEQCTCKECSKEKWQKGAEFGYNKCNEQLIKAKEIIKDYMTIVKGAHTAVCGVSEENRTIYVLKLNEEAEQFLKESN